MVLTSEDRKRPSSRSGEMSDNDNDDAENRAPSD